MVNQLSISDYKLAYRISGTGQTVLFINGLNQHMDTWYKVENELKDECRMIFYNRAGMYPSTIGEEGRNTNINVKDIKQIIEELNDNQPVIIVGHSYGGLIAQQFAHDYPELVKQVIVKGEVHLDEDIYGEHWIEFCKTRGYSTQPIDGIALQFDNKKNIPPHILANVEAMYQEHAFYRMMYEELMDWKCRTEITDDDTHKEVENDEQIVEEIRHLI